MCGECEGWANGWKRGLGCVAKWVVGEAFDWSFGDESLGEYEKVFVMMDNQQ